MQKCYSYALAQNKEDKVGPERALRNITPRVFDDHRGCGEWCQILEDAHRKHGGLPYGKPLQGAE